LKPAKGSASRIDRAVSAPSWNAEKKENLSLTVVAAIGLTGPVAARSLAQSSGSVI
jgi:hypothetical protein